MAFGAGKPVFCTLFLTVSDTEWYQWWAMGDSLQSVQPCLFIASSHGASQIPDLLTMTPEAFCFPFWTRREVLRSIRQGCLRETIPLGQICAWGDKAPGGWPRPWQPPQSAAAALCSCEPGTGGGRSSLASDQSWGSSGQVNSMGCFHLRSGRFKCSLAHRPLAKEN